MGMPSWCTLTEVTAGLRHASVLPLDPFDGLLDPATRSQLAVLRGYGVLGVPGQTTSLLGLDSCLFLPELCLTTAKAADAAPPSKNRPLLIGAAMADKESKRCSNHDSKAVVTERTEAYAPDRGRSSRLSLSMHCKFRLNRTAVWRRTTVYKAQRRQELSSGCRI